MPGSGDGTLPFCSVAAAWSLRCAWRGEQRRCRFSYVTQRPPRGGPAGLPLAAARLEAGDKDPERVGDEHVDDPRGGRHRERRDAACAGQRGGGPCVGVERRGGGCVRVAVGRERTEGGLLGDAQDDRFDAGIEVEVDGVGDGEADGGGAKACVEALRTEGGRHHSGQGCTANPTPWQVAEPDPSAWGRKWGGSTRLHACHPSCWIMWRRAGSIALGREAACAGGHFGSDVSGSRVKGGPAASAAAPCHETSAQPPAYERHSEQRQQPLPPRSAS